MAVPVHVIGGFLGAGKTTTLLGLIEGPLAGERVALVINDFGESAVDQTTVSEQQVAVAEIRGACVCCTAPEGFVGAVGDLLDEVAPDRIVVEPTGLARPADLVDTLRRAPYADRLDLRPLIILVDPEVLQVETHAELREQAACADVLVANRTDLASTEALEGLRTWVGALWPGPLACHETTFGRVPASVLDWPEGTGPRGRPGGVEPHAHSHHHGHTARTWTWPPETVFSRARLLTALEDLATGAAGSLARAKGLMRTDEGWSRVEVAGGRVHTASTDWRRDSRVDLIFAVGADLDHAGTLLQAAERTASERAEGALGVEVGLPDGAVRRFDRSMLAALPGEVADVSTLLPGRSGSAARVAAVFDAVGAPESATAVVVAADGYTTPPVPASALRSGLLIHSLEDAPLPARAGGPIRLMIPGDAGPGGPCANVKGVVRIALRRP